MVAIIVVAIAALVTVPWLLARREAGRRFNGTVVSKETIVRQSPYGTAGTHVLVARGADGAIERFPVSEALYRTAQPGMRVSKRRGQSSVTLMK